MAEWLARWSQQWVVEGTSEILGSRFEVSIQLMKQFALNSSLPGQNGLHFADDVFGCIFVNEMFYILIKISLKFVPKDPVNNNTALV